MICTQRDLKLFPAELHFRSEFHRTKTNQSSSQHRDVSVFRKSESLEASAARLTKPHSLMPHYPIAGSRPQVEDSGAPASWLALAKLALVDGKVLRTAENVAERFTSEIR